MRTTVFSSAYLALRDWRHEWLLSLCSVCALASIIAPLLVVYGVRSGVIDTLKERLMSDPSVLVVMPQGGRAEGFSEDFIEKIRSLPETSFAVARTRDVASEIQLVSPKKKYLTVTLEPTADGDPIMQREQIATPLFSLQKPEIVLSASAARKLGAAKGDCLTAQMTRRSQGRLERTEVSLAVTAVLPATASGTDTAFVPADLLLAVQDYRDNIDNPRLGITGYNALPQRRHYESFRLYAADLESVERLAAWFEQQNIAVKTRAREIANLRRMDESFSTIVAVIGGAAGVGFLFFIISSTAAGVQRKRKTLGLLRLLGFSRRALRCYPTAQSLCTVLCGWVLALGVYFLAQYILNSHFSELTGGGIICRVAPADFLISLGGILLLTAVISYSVSCPASNVEPSEVIRQL